MSGRILSLFINGTPIPQGSKTARVINGRPIMYEANRKHAAWRKDVVEGVRHYFKAIGGRDVVSIPRTSSAKVWLTFYFDKPKSNTSEDMVKKPDIDKLSRAILDGLVEAGLLHDDSQVIKLVAEKKWADKPMITAGCYIDMEWS